MSNHWQGHKVLVTGAEGFIGSTLVEHLLSEGADVRALVHYKPYGSAGHLAGLEQHVETVAGDVRDPGLVDHAVAGRETVFHLAALIGIPYSYLAPDSYVQTNVVGTHNVSASCLRHGARLVHTSTSETYGTARRVPIDEEHPQQPQSPYSASKIGADMLALSYHHAFELPVAVVRPFNTYGPRQSARAVVPSILGQLHAGVGELRLGALTPTRDLTYVDDTVRGFLSIGSCDRALGQVLNLGSGREISIGDLAEMLIRITGADATVVRDTERLRPAGSEVERLVADNGRVRELTGWRPRIPLREGLSRTSDWLLAHRAATRYEV